MGEKLGSATNALRLVLLLGERGRIRVTEVAEELEVAPSTAHRLLGALARWGFAIQDEDRCYLQGPAYVQLQLSASATDGLRLVVRSHLQKLAALIGETTHMVTLEGSSVRFAYSAEGPGVLRVASRMGAVLPAHSTSGGKALLAELPEADLVERFAGGVPASPGSKITTLDDLLAELAVIRAQKYAINLNESEPGISAVGVAIKHRTGNPIAGLSISAPSVRFREEHLGEWVDHLHQVAARISMALWTSPS